MNTTASPSVEPAGPLPAGFETGPIPSGHAATAPVAPAAPAEEAVPASPPIPPAGEGQIMFRPVPGGTVPLLVAAAPAQQTFAEKAKAWAANRIGVVPAAIPAVETTAAESVAVEPAPRAPRRSTLYWVLALLAVIALSGAALYYQAAATAATAASYEQKLKEVSEAAQHRLDLEKSAPWWHRLNQW